MCGICGVIHFSDAPVDPGAMDRACKTLNHRGPDHSETWIDPATGCVALAAARLAILDPTPAGHQPIHRSQNRFHLVFNGEIYNFRQLRHELAGLGEAFVGDCDAEVVLAACARWGEDAPRRFNGMWALAFYDSQQRRGFLCRDRFGIKPLVYAQDGETLCFSSELRAIRALGIFESGIDRQAVIELVRFGYVAHPRTIDSHVRRLPPGHLIRFTASGAEPPRRYYHLASEVSHSNPPSYQAACREVRFRLGEAISAQTVSDVPIGAFLSGGLDSSIVVAHLSAALGHPVKTFSVGYADHPAYDEARFARLVADRFCTEHQEVILSEKEVLAEFPRILDHLDEPFGDSSIIPTALLSRIVSDHVSVALSGDGGDELFGGYWRYLGHYACAAYRRIPHGLRTWVLNPTLGIFRSSRSSAFGNRIRQVRKLLRAAGDDPLRRHIAWSRIVSPDAECILSDALDATARDEPMVRLAQSLTDGWNGDDRLNQVMAFDVQHQLPADMLHKVDTASMMHSLEVRVPFLDPRVVEYAFGLPSTFKIRRGLRKRILIEAYRDLLPDEILDRPKQGFELPIGEYFQASLKPMFLDTVTRERIDELGVFRYSEIERVFEDHVAHRADHADLLFAILSLCWWVSAQDPRSGSRTLRPSVTSRAAW